MPENLSVRETSRIISSSLGELRNKKLYMNQKLCNNADIDWDDVRAHDAQHLGSLGWEHPTTPDSQDIRSLFPSDPKPTLSTLLTALKELIGDGSISVYSETVRVPGPVYAIVPSVFDPNDQPMKTS